MQYATTLGSSARCRLWLCAPCLAHERFGWPDDAPVNFLARAARCRLAERRWRVTLLHAEWEIPMRLWGVQSAR